MAADSTQQLQKDCEHLAKTACERDDTSLIEQAFSNCSEKGNLQYLLYISCRGAIQNNSENVLKNLVEKQGLDVRRLPPTFVAGEGLSTAILEFLLAHGWDLNFRHTSESGDGDAMPFMWHIVGDADLVAWCLGHGANLTPIRQGPLVKCEITKDQYSCEQLLERAAAHASVATFELLRSRGAPLGWRPLHRAVFAAAFALDAARRSEEKKAEGGGGETDEARKAVVERMDMVRHLIDVVGIDVNALDHPVGKKSQDRMGTPIVYVAYLDCFHHTRELTWLLLDRGADPTPGLVEAKETGHPTFADDVEAWKAQHPYKSWWNIAKANIFGR
jgi:hypothetical protein